MSYSESLPQLDFPRASNNILPSSKQTNKQTRKTKNRQSELARPLYLNEQPSEKMQLFLTLFALFFVTVQVFAGTLPVTPEVINGTYGLAGTCGGNCPSNTCTDCYCGTSASYVDIASWCSQHSWNQVNN